MKEQGGIPVGGAQFGEPGDKLVSRAPANDRAKQQATSNDLENRFTYHTVKPGQAERYGWIREEAKRLAYLITEQCPPSRELSLALTHLEEVVMWANASIARHE